MNLQEFININEIKQITISDSIFNNKHPILDNIKFSDYSNNIDNTIFFGMYNSTDYKKLNNHKGKKWIFWCGSDFEINSKRRYKCIKKMLIQEKNLQGHLCKIKSIYNNLNILDLNPILINDNLDDFTKSENLDKFNKLVSIILPTLNRLEGFKNVVNQILNQTYENFELIIVDDGSDNDILIKKEEFINSLNNNKIKMLKNIVNKNLPYSINKGINNSNGDFITWISDDNNYYNIFIESLVHENYDFIYSNFELYFEDLGKTKNIKKKYNSINDLISNYAGLASFMYSRNLINKIGLYNTNLFKIEDYEYLLRIYNNTDKIKHIPISTMNYKRHSESLYAQNENNINKMSEDVNFIYQTIQNNKFQNIFLYYSKTRWNLLFQRPHQIMRFMDKTLFKVFITSDDIIKFEDKYNLLIINYKYKDIIFDNFNDIIIYYTDTRLYNEISNYEHKKLFDLIDAPIDEFSIWKPNLEKCVKNSYYVIYSHPDLIKFLNEIDTSKDYKYISNACDYEHFSPAKHRIDERPFDFPQTDKLILGYYGAFSEWLDYDIIRKYADEGLYHIVMIGGILGNAKYNMRFEHENITWLDHKSYDELPYYLSWFDKCFLPFKDCELTNYVNPCKLWEYMASEKEIIRHNVNMDVNEIVIYDDICNIIYNIIYNIYNYKIINEYDYKYNLFYLNKINNNILINCKSIKHNNKPTIFIFSMIDYYFRIQRNQHIARLLSEKGYQIFYLTTKLQNTENKIHIINNNLYEVSLYCNSNNDINIYNTTLQLNEIKSIIESIDNLKSNYNFNYFISYITNPFWYQVVKNINNTGVIFDCLDYTKGFNTHSHTIINEEEKILYLHLPC